MGLIMQEVSQERYIEIPDEVRDIYRLYRPSPVYRARTLEKMLDTPAKIYYKSEHVSPVGSHKLNTALMQAYMNKKEGVKRIATETSAGQWGSALACACQLMEMECMVYMVRISYDQKPYRRIMMKTYGARSYPAHPTLPNPGATSSSRIQIRQEAWGSPFQKRSKMPPNGTIQSTPSAAC